MRLFLLCALVTVGSSGGELKQRALALLGHWVEAQNQGDAAAYLALYDHAHFRGRKRTLRGATELDWKGWSADRTAMLKRRPTVAAERPTVETWLDRGSKLQRGIVRLRFVQRWKSARYADHGTKVLDLFAQPDGTVLVLHEDLLNSEPGWDDAPTAAGDGKLARVTSVDEAERVLAAIGLRAGNVEAVLGALPDAPQLRRVVALAILERGAFACEDVVRQSECGEDIVEWAALDGERPWSDPCVRRRGALWALAHGGLSAADLARLADRLTPLLSAPKPEVEIPTAVLALSGAAPDALRLRLLRAAIEGEHRDLAEAALTGLSRGSLAALAREQHLDGAARALDAQTQRTDVLAALRDDALTVETRTQLVHAIAALPGADVSAALRDVADDAASCALSASAGLVLAVRGDASRLPRRPAANASADALGRALCRLLHDPDDVRAQRRWLEFLPARGKIKVVEELHDDFGERDEDGNRVETPPTVETFTRAGSTLSNDLPRAIGEGDAPSCDGDSCDFTVGDGHYTLVFKGGRLVEITHSRWNGCPC